MSHTFRKTASKNNNECPHPRAVATGKPLHPYFTEPQKASWEADEQRSAPSTEGEVRHGKLICKVTSHCLSTPKCEHQAKLATGLTGPAFSYYASAFSLTSNHSKLQFHLFKSET